MSRKLISGNDIISFTPASGIIVVKGYVPISKLLLINNVTVNTTIFNFSDPTTPATVTYDSEQNISTIDLSYDTSSMSSSDKIQLYYEQGDIEIKPARTYRDPVSKFRVSNPETLIDTDFEYGPQPTKWETLKLVNNIPTSYSSPFTENSISLSSVTVTENSNLMTIESSETSSLSLGGVVEINGLNDSQYEGTFIIKDISSNTFSVKLPFISPKNSSLATIYSIAYKGAFYTGSSVSVEEVQTSTGAASTITVTTPNIHGFNDYTKLYLKNSRATKRFSFDVPDSVVGVGTTNYKSEIRSSDFLTPPEPEYYNNLRVIADDIVGKFEINVQSSDINTSNGNIVYSTSTQQNDASFAGISTGEVLTFYTHVENSTLGRLGSPIQNFTPFRVSSVSTNSGITTFRLSDSYASVLEYVPTSAGTVSFGNHRFIRGYRIVSFSSSNIINFSSPVDFSLNSSIIITTNYTTSTYDAYTRSYITKYNGQYNKSSYPYYLYNVSAISEDRRTITVTNVSPTPSPGFLVRDVETLQPNYIWAASSIINHPLSNTLYLPPSSGFSTSSYDDYQFAKYLNPNNVTKIPSLTNNANYILRKSSKENWYRIASGNNSSDTTVNWENPIDLYFNVASNPLNPALTSGTATNVLTVGIHTITSASPLKNSNTISLPDRGGLVNNSSVVYNTTVSPIGNLTANNSYKIKTEDVSLSSDSFRLSSYNESVKLYGFSYSAGTSVATIYVYDTEDRASSSLDGLNSAGIISGNTIQISGSEYPNPIKKQSINRRFDITSTPTVYTSTTKDASSPVGTRKYIYNFTVAIPQDGSFNTDTAISIFAGQTYADSALGNTKCTAITNLDISNPATTGEHTLTQNIDGAVDDIYQTVNTSSDTFQFRTLVEIPEITKNIANFSSSAEAAITLTNSPAYFSVTNNGTVNLQATPAFANSFLYKSTVSNVTYTAPVSIEFRLINATSYQFAVGFSETNSSSLRYTNGYTWVQDTYSSGTSFAYGTGAGNLYSDRSFDSAYVYKIEYNADGNIRWYKNGSLVASTNAGTGKSFRVYVSYYDYTGYTSTGMNVINLKIASSSLPFTPGSTDYLKVASHNFADGTEVVYQTSGAESILPLVNDQQYYVRVLDGDYIGLTNSFETAIDRTQPLIGFTTTGSLGATNNLKTLSVRGFLNGKGTVAISTTSDLVTGTDTAFLTDFINGDTFRAYNLGIGTPGEYFESKISSIKSDKILKLELTPSFSSDNANYFKQTALYPVSDGKVSHRPFDGGVSMYSGLVPNTKVIRQTRKYFRYQSGKGIQVSMAVNFNPTNDIDVISKVGSGSTSTYNIKSKFPHKLSPSAAINVNSDSPQRIILSDIVGSASNFFNRKTTENGFPILDVLDDSNFTVDIGNPVGVDDISGFPKYVVKNWKDASLKAGLFDDQNGFYLECDGSTLYAVRRSSTQQLSGQYFIQRNSYLIQGENSILTKQVSVNDYIVIRGQTYKVTAVLSDTALNIQPSYRGNTSSNVVISKVINTRVPQSEWNIDRMDGTGESGYNIDISKVQMIYMDYSWYGAGSVRFGFKDQLGEVKYCHEFVHNNIFTESYFRSGNLPARYEVETFANPFYSPALSHWGVSVIMDGRFDSDKAYLFTADSDALTFSGDGQSTTFTGRVTEGSRTMTGIDSTEFQSLVVGQTIIPTTSYTNYLQSDTIISEINIDRAGNTFFGGNPTYKITMSKPALLTSTSFSFNTGSGNAVDIQSLIPLVSIRLSPSVDNSNIGGLGFRDIINRMQLTLKSAGVLTTHDCEVRLVLNGKLSDESFSGVTSPSLSQVYKHAVGDKVTEGITVYSFRARGGTPINATSGRKNLNGTDVSLDELALLGNSILGGDGTFPDGPDVLTLAVKVLEPSSINGGSPLVVSARITWTEAQA